MRDVLQDKHNALSRRKRKEAGRILTPTENETRRKNKEAGLILTQIEEDCIHVFKSEIAALFVL